MHMICLCTVAFASILSIGLALHASEGRSSDKHTKVEIKTTLGNITVELDPQSAPETVKNFLTYVQEGFYKGTIFHRVIDGFMIQAGGFTKDMKQKATHAPVKIESNNGLSNKRGTIAMARTSDPNSATAQFFINVAANSFLDYRDKTLSGYGYTVFGHVTSGMDIVDKIRRVETTTKGPFENVPVEPVEILEVVELH